MKRALFIVDPQLDFMQGGVKEVPFGDRIIPTINSIIDLFNIVVVSRTHMSEDSKDFLGNPPYCVKGTNGAKINSDLKFDGEIFTRESLKINGLFSTNSKNKTVYQYFKENEIEQVYIAGLVGDRHLKDVALECCKNYKTHVILDAVKFKRSPDSTIKMFIDNNIVIVNSKNLKFLFSNKEPYKNSKPKSSKPKMDKDKKETSPDATRYSTSSGTVYYNTTTITSTTHENHVYIPVNDPDDNFI